MLQQINKFKQKITEIVKGIRYNIVLSNFIVYMKP